MMVPCESNDVGMISVLLQFKYLSNKTVHFFWFSVANMTDPCASGLHVTTTKISISPVNKYDP